MSFALNYSQTETDLLIQKLTHQWIEEEDPSEPMPDLAKTFKFYICDHALSKLDQQRVVLINNAFYAQYESVNSFDTVREGRHIPHNPCGPAIVWQKKYFYNGLRCRDGDHYLDAMFGHDNTAANINLALKAEFKLMIL